MARTTATNFTGVNQFPKADAATDLFKKEDVQTLALAVDAHDHTAGKGAALVAGSIPAGSITSAMIADLTVDTADLKDGAVTSAKIADGTIATVDLANSAVTNAKLGTDTARANLLTNGGFEVWQRNAGPFTVGLSYSADRWQTSLSGTDTLSVSRTSAVVDTGSQFAASLTFTKGSGTNTAFIQFVEDFNQLRGKSVTFSIRVQSNAASSVRPWIYEAGGGARVYGAYHTGNSTFQTLTVTGNVPSNAAAQIQIGLELNVSCTAYADNAMLVVGSVPADYAPLHPADDLARCLRYYEANLVGITMGAGGLIIRGNTAAGSVQFGQSYMFKARKALTPTVTVVGTWSSTNAATPPTLGVLGMDSFDLFGTSSAAGYCVIYASGAAAGIIAESNP